MYFTISRLFHCESYLAGIKVILDFIPNLTSKNHTWFRDSSSSADTSNFKRNYYVWVEGHNNTAQMAPNNWVSGSHPEYLLTLT